MQGGATGTGTVTLLAPSTSTSRVLTLPDSTGTVLNDQSNIEAQVKTATNASGSAPVYACRAWVNFNGTGTIAIRGSGNVSSITDGGVGNYLVNFTTAMPDANYSALAIANNSGSTAAAATRIGNATSISSVRIYTTGFNTTDTDFDAVSVVIFR